MVLKQIARLAGECGADRLQCREVDRARFAGFEDGQVGERDVVYRQVPANSLLNMKQLQGGKGASTFACCSITYFCFSKSRISVNSTSSLEGLGGSAGAASSFFFMEFIALITMKMAKAMMMKSTIVWMKLP